MEIVLVACIAGLAPTLTVIVSYFLNRKRVNEIHVLVNSRLQAALTKVDILKAELRKDESNSI